eukprot:g63231.t1
MHIIAHVVCVRVLGLVGGLFRFVYLAILELTLSHCAVVGFLVLLLIWLRVHFLTMAKPKAVLCVETGKLYPSVRNAAWEIGPPVQHQNIHRAIKSASRCGGFTWVYTNAELQLDQA